MVDASSGNDSVKVAVRVRPLVQSEISKGCRNILEVLKDINQIRISDSEKAFTYNYVFGPETEQDNFYTTCIKNMLDNLFKGYNLTILAYGQTGSGKTHSMGTAYNGGTDMGVIPRAVHDIFNFVNDNFAYDITITVSFMEVYKEVLYDLLADKPRDQCVVEIREDNRGIIIPNLTEKPVKSATEALQSLIKGSHGRAVGSTNMNSQSSRSHAIYTLSICLQKKGNSSINKTAKFHLVDLAGSERSKKTGATGQTFKEGVNINKGLLALGNVISALGDERQQNGYISYRDSNLTRLLKDSLGGNSITLMVACVSPADYNMEETLSTLRYADRARKIKNKPVVNEDPKTAENVRLTKLVEQLRLELLGQGGSVICQAEFELLKKENSDLKIKNRDLNSKLSMTLIDKALLFERVQIIQDANEKLQKRLLELQDEYNVTLNQFNLSIEQGDVTAIKDHVNKLQSIQKHFTEIGTEYKKNQNEIRKHERTIVLSTDNSRLSTEVEVNERQETHTAQQYNLNNELQEVIKNLATKEHLVEQIAQNAIQMVDYGEKAETEAKIIALEKERDALLQLKPINSNEPSSKLAEQRRKRVQELEFQILDLKKKVQELQRLIKLKEKDEQRIKQLNNEIVQMKQVKVKLIKSMKQEADNFRVWKLQKERDVLKLKEQDRKRENQMIKMQTMHSRQQNVLKRKVEQAVAINKRLKDALALRKCIQEKNFGKLERIDNWIKQELEIYVNTLEARFTLTSLMEDRAALSEQLEQLKTLEFPNEDMSQLESDIEIRSINIGRLQQKLMDSDEEERGKTRWDNVQSMAEAKHGLACLFELVAKIKKEEFIANQKVLEQQLLKSELEQQIQELTLKIHSLEEEHAETKAEVDRENEEKITVLLKQLRRVEGKQDEDDQTDKRIAIQNETIHKQELQIETLNAEILAQKDIVAQREQQIKELQEEINSKNQSFELTNNTEKSLENRKRKKAVPIIDIEPFIPESPLGTLDDKIKDPDWAKTPLGKRITTIKVTEKGVPERHTSKRNSEGGCNCKSNCERKVCGCRKFSKDCTAACKCGDGCKNNKGVKDSLRNSDIIDESENEDFEIKKPRIPLHASKPRKTRKLLPNPEGPITVD